MNDLWLVLRRLLAVLWVTVGVLFVIAGVIGVAGIGLIPFLLFFGVPGWLLYNWGWRPKGAGAAQ